MSDRFFMYKDLDPQSRQRKRMEVFTTYINSIKQGKLEKLRKFRAVYDTKMIYNLKVIKSKIESTDLNQVYEGVVEFRHTLSADSSPPIQAVVDSGVVPRFVELLSKKSRVYTNGDENLIRSIRLETGWVITNIASGSSVQTKVIVEFGACPLLVDMLSENDEEIVDQAVWALGNISGESEKMRNMIIFSNATEVLSKIGIILSSEKKYIKILRNIVWLLSNLNRGNNPPPPIESIYNSMPLLEKLIQSEDSDVLTDALWTSVYISEFSQESANLILRSPIFENILVYLNSASNNNFSTGSVFPLVKFPGALASSSPELVPLLIEKGFVKVIFEMFFTYDKISKLVRTKKEICWSFSKLVNSSPLCLEYFYNLDIVRLLSIGLENDNIISKECIHTLFILLKNDELSFKFIEKYENRLFIGNLIDTLEVFSDNPKLLVKILTCLGKLLKAFSALQRPTEVQKWIIELELGDKLRFLDGETNENVRQLASSLRSAFF